MKLIVAPTDFSDNATNSLEYAVETAHHTGAALLLVHVYRPPVVMQSAVHSVMTDDLGRSTKAAREKLQYIVATIAAEFPDVTVSFEILLGDPVPEILTFSRDRDVDLIVMGTQGASRVVNVLFGSNTAAIIEKSHCPVLCIPAGLPYKAPRKILYTTNFSFSDIESARLLTELARSFEADIVFGHVVVGVEETDEEKAVIEKFAKEIQLVTGYNRISGVVISDANVNTGLDALIEKTGVDMIALATRKRSLFGKIYNPSITKKFSYYTTIPLLAFHSPKDVDQVGPDFR